MKLEHYETETHKTFGVAMFPSTKMDGRSRVSCTRTPQTCSLRKSYRDIGTCGPLPLRGDVSLADIRDAAFGVVDGHSYEPFLRAQR
jgi:hypothetical protein